MVVVSNEAAAAGALRRIAGRQIQLKKRTEYKATPLPGHEFERSKLLSATLPLVTRMFLLGQVEPIWFTRLPFAKFRDNASLY